MRWLLFLSRLAFICGCCFLASLVFAMIRTENIEPFSQSIIIIGHIIGMIVVPIVLIAYLVVYLWRKRISDIVPVWLIASNIFFLFVFIFYLFQINK